MGDLQKFIRQQFFDNHWTRDVDATTLADDKLEAIDSAFSNIDVKSKLCLLLSLSNLKPNISPEIDKPVESIFLQALDEENNLVKAVATILHTKQSLNYLNFDISPTNEAFRKNIEKLLKHSHGWKVTATPLLAEYLGENVLSAGKGKPATKSLSTSGKKQPSGLSERRAERILSFRCRGKPPTVTMKETYLEKLTDECQRRRVHVPIPGRSFARSDEADDNGETENSGFLSSQTVKRTPFSSQNRKTSGLSSWSSSSENAARKLNLPWPRPNADLLDKPPSLLTPSERLAARTPASNCRKPSRIKILDFDELPAFGPKAKQLRKEQMEKERELKRQEREERMKEQKAAREAAKLARQSEKQTLMEARRQPTSTSWTDVPHVSISAASDALMKSEAESISNRGNGNFSGLLDNTGIRLNYTSSEHPMESGRTFSYLTSVPGNTGSNLVFANRPNNPVFMVRHPLLSASTGMNVVQGVVDDDDEDDDDNDGMMLQDSGTGTYQLGISSDFRGFNPAARVSLHASNPTATASNQPNFSIAPAPPGPFVSTMNTSYSPYGVCQPPASQTVAPSSQSTGMVISNQNPQVGFTTPRSVATGAGHAGTTIRLVSGTQLGTQIRLIQPSQARIIVPNQLPRSSANSVTLASLQSATGTRVGTPTFRTVLQPTTTAAPQAETKPQLIQPANMTAQPTTLSTPSTTAPRLLAAISSAGPNTGGLIRIAPRPTRLVRLASTNTAVGLQPRQPQQQPVPVSLAPTPTQPTSVQLSPVQFQQLQQTALSSSPARPANTAWTVDGRQVILAPMMSVTNQQSPPTGGMLSPKHVLQSPPSGYIQIMPRPTGAAPVSFTSTPGQQQTFSIVQSQPQSVQNTTLYTGMQMAQPDGRIVVCSSQSMENQFSSSVEATSGQPTVKIQDDLRLTEAQLSSVQSLFQGANRVSRPEKAMIVSFIAGARGNPRPETGNTLRIRLSEYRERVLNQATGQLMDVAADTYLHMDYSTGTCEKVKYYRNEPPDVLLRLPVQPALH